MKRLLEHATLVSTVLMIISILTCVWYANMNKRLSDELDSSRRNETSLLSGMQNYMIRDSLNAAQIKALELSMKELKEYRAEDLVLLKDLTAKVKDLTQYQKVGTTTINTIQTTVRDSIVRDTVVPYISYNTKWLELNGYIKDSVFNGTVVSKDYLYITEETKYKRFLGFLWKTSKIKSQTYKVVSENPNTVVSGFEVIKLK